MPKATSPMSDNDLDPKTRRICKILGAISPFLVADVAEADCDVRVQHERPLEYRDADHTWKQVMETMKAGDELRPRWASRGDLAKFEADSREGANFRFAARGGRTEVFLTLSDGTYAVGRAICSTEDGFCYKIGRELATKRAIDRLNLILAARKQDGFAEGGHFEDDGAAVEEANELRAELIRVRAALTNAENRAVAAENRVKGPIPLERARGLLRRPEAAQALFDELAPYFKKELGPPDATIYDALMAAVEVAVEKEAETR